MRLPVVSGRAAIAAFQRLGFTVRRQRGSHVSMVRDFPYGAVSVPLHPEIKPGTLLGMIKRAGVSRAAFLEALR